MEWKINNFVKGRRTFGAFLLVILFLLTVPDRAFALKLRIQNDFDKTMNSAVVYHDASRGWTARGWYVTKAGESRTFDFGGSRDTIYVHSHLAGDAKTAWGRGDVTRVVVNNAFMYADGGECPSGPDRRTVKFTKYSAKKGVVDYRPVRDNKEPLPTAGGSVFSVPQTELLKLINAERRRVGARELKLDDALSKAAAQRAVELPKVWGHTRPGGRSYSSVFAEFGLKPAKSGENVASNSKPLKASNFHRQFMDSPGHKKTMLNPDYSAVGLAFHQEGGMTYCVELFTDGGAIPVKKPASDDLAVVAANVMNLVNNERTKAGLKPLGTNAKLNAAALTRAREVAVKADISIRPDGRRYDTVFGDHGLAYGQTASSGTRSDGANSLEIFQKLYEDPSTRKTMATAEFTALGAAVVREGGGYYCLLLYGGPAPKEKSLEESWKELEDAFRELRDLF